ncbi:MAG: hypothetical protein KIT27_04150 [Legionellales bacterium]|nr:hypothetical protein [Legionellales bacterium]
MIIAYHRNLLATLILSLMLSGNILMAGIFALVAGQGLKNGISPSLMLNVIGALYILNIACIIGLFCWRKIGFYGLCLSAIISSALNLIHLDHGVMQVLVPYASPIIIYLALQLGGENRMWFKLS